MEYAVKQFLYDLNAFPIREPTRVMAENKLKQRADALLRQHAIEGVSTEVSGGQLIIRRTDRTAGAASGKRLRIPFMLHNIPIRNYYPDQHMLTGRPQFSVQVFVMNESPFRTFRDFCENAGDTHAV